MGAFALFINPTAEFGQNGWVKPTAGFGWGKVGGKGSPKGREVIWRWAAHREGGAFIVSGQPTVREARLLSVTSDQGASVAVGKGRLFVDRQAGKSRQAWPRAGGMVKCR